jgi:hypothetical protein
MPVGAAGRITFCAGVSAEGILFASAASTWNRIVAAEGIDISSLYIRLFDWEEVNYGLHKK